MHVRLTRAFRKQMGSDVIINFLLFVSLSNIRSKPQDRSRTDSLSALHIAQQPSATLFKLSSDKVRKTTFPVSCTVERLRKCSTVPAHSPSSSSSSANSTALSLNSRPLSFYVSKLYTYINCSHIKTG